MRRKVSSKDYAKRVPEAKNVAYRSVAKLSPKPYPDHEGVANAYKLCCLKSPETEEMSPMALGIFTT